MDYQYLYTCQRVISLPVRIKLLEKRACVKQIINSVLPGLKYFILHSCLRSFFLCGKSQLM